jgi:hypothetical protein
LPIADGDDVAPFLTCRIRRVANVSVLARMVGTRRTQAICLPWPPALFTAYGSNIEISNLRLG